MPADSDFSPLSRIETRPIIVCSHPRSGTHLTIDLLRRHFPDCAAWKLPGQSPGWLAPSLDAAIDDSQSQMNPEMFCAAVGRCRRPIVKTHRMMSELLGTSPWRGPEAPPVVLDWLRERGSFCYAYRDGRSVMMSYHVYSKQYDQRSRCPISEFIRQPSEIPEMSRAAYWSKHVDDGTADQSIHRLDFRDTVSNTAQQLADLSETLGMELRQRERLLPNPIRNAAQYRLAHLLGIRPESSAQPNPEGKRPPKWQDSLTQEDRDFFNQECGETLIRLGMESSGAWTHENHGASRPLQESTG